MRPVSFDATQLRVNNRFLPETAYLQIDHLPHGRSNSERNDRKTGRHSGTSNDCSWPVGDPAPGYREHSLPRITVIVNLFVRSFPQGARMRTIAT